MTRDRKTSKIFPSYGITSPAQSFKTMKHETDVPDEQLRLECSNNDKLYFKQKFFMKEFMELLIRSNINPNSRKRK